MSVERDNPKAFSAAPKGSSLLLWARVSIYAQELLAGSAVVVNFLSAWLWQRFSRQIASYPHGTSLHDVAYNETILAGLHLAFAGLIIGVATRMSGAYSWRWWCLTLGAAVSVLGTLSSHAVGFGNALIPLSFVLLMVMAFTYQQRGDLTVEASHAVVPISAAQREWGRGKAARKRKR